MRQFSDSHRPSTGGFPAASAPMRKLIRCKSTQTFLTKQGTWTKDIREACHFPDFSTAHAAKTQFPWHDLEIYYSFDPNQSSQYDFALAAS